MNHNLDALSSLAIELAVTAGGILQKGRETGFGQIETKSSAVDIVTEIDVASERYIASTIRDRRPDDAIFGEEGTLVEGTSGVRWLVDPLDGTVNFIYGIPAYAVSIGVEIDGIPTIGAVYNPSTNELYRAIRGQGAFLNDVRLFIRDDTELASALVATGFSYQSDRRSQQAATLQILLPLVRDIRRFGSAALDLCWLAAGRTNAYYEFAVSPWDICAGDVIATEAGALVTASDGGLARHTIIASTPVLHEQLRQLIAI